MTARRVVLTVSALLSASLIIWNYIGNYRLCDYFSSSGSAGDCPTVLTGVGMMFLPIFPLFFFSLVTYFMREEVFRLWVKFAIPGVLLSMLLVFLTPEGSAGGFGPQIVFGKSDTALAASALFSLISIIIILIAWWRARSK